MSRSVRDASTFHGLRLMAAALALAIAGATPALAQLTAFTWTVQGDASGYVAVEPYQLTIWGPNSPTGGCSGSAGKFGGGNATWLEAVAPLDGTVRCTFEFILLDQGISPWSFDHPEYFVDGVPTQVGLPGPTPSGVHELAFEVSAGQAFGFGVLSVDCSYGPGVAEITNFFFDPGTWSDRGQALDPRRRLGLVGLADDGHFGAALSTAGDVDADGRADFAVGAPDDGGGVLRVYSGNDGSLIDELPGSFGFSAAVAAVGDTDLDGRLEIIVGTPKHGALGHKTGRITVLDALSGAVLHEITGPAAGWELGSDVLGPGDLDDDGHADFAAGLPHFVLGPANHPGEVRVYSGTDAHVLLTLTTGDEDDALGRDIAAAGDVDLDGVPDLLVLAGSSSRAYVFSGRDGQLLLDVSGPVMGEAHRDVLASAGDVDLDGHPDFAVGLGQLSIPFLSQGGAVRIHSGADGSQLHQFAGEFPNERFGWSLAGGSDIDGDGFTDLVVGAPGWRDELGDVVGRVQVIRARDGVLGPRFNGGISEVLGDAVALLGDVDGDSLPDLVAGLPQAGLPDAGFPAKGLVEVFDQLDDSPGKRPRLSGLGKLQPGTTFGLRLQGARPHAPMFTLIGFAYAQEPFAGGVLVPSPDAVVLGTTDAHGGALLAGLWPTNFVAFSKLVFQTWIRDPVATYGYSASNGLQATTGLAP